MRDTLFANPQDEPRPFRFDAAVAQVFDDMIRRSVPGYQQIIEQIAALATSQVHDNSCVYDLGCSLGTATLAMRRSIKAENVEIIAIDNSAAMLERCQMLLQAYHSDIAVQLVNADIAEYNYDNASLMVMNFTLQFIPPEQRLAVIKRLYDGLRAGGILVLSEKIRFPDTTMNNLMIQLHEDFKRQQGYSELEISQKRDALQDVMITETLDTHRQRLLDVGFSSVAVWYQEYNFMSLVAIK